MPVSRKEVVWAFRVFLRDDAPPRDLVDTVAAEFRRRSRRALAETALVTVVKQRRGPLTGLFRVSANSGEAVLSRAPDLLPIDPAAPPREGAPANSKPRLSWRILAGRNRERTSEGAEFSIASREDILWCYRMLLGREPEESELLANAGRVSRDEMVRDIARSPEFLSTGHLAHLFVLPRVSIVHEVPAHAASADMSIAVIGNCQVHNVARCIQALTADVLPVAHELTQREADILSQGRLDLGELVDGYDLIVAQAPYGAHLARRYPSAAAKITVMPQVGFAAFHPDIVEAKFRSTEKQVRSPHGLNNSSIILYAWVRGLSVLETVALFNEATYRRLGFFHYWRSSERLLLDHGRGIGLPLEEALERWRKRGCFMHTINHPRLCVAADITRMVLNQRGIACLPGHPELHVVDHFQVFEDWPVYPELGERLGVEGGYLFQVPPSECPPEQPVLYWDLREFVERSFAKLAEHSRDEIDCERLRSDRYRDLERTSGETVPVRVPLMAGTRGQHPYKALPDHNFWQRAVASQPAGAIDPVVSAKFTISATDAVATAGSCFAQYIAQRLRSRGLNYHVAEPAPQKLGAEEALRRNYEVFSARYGNVYTARQLAQLFERAYGEFLPQDTAWVRGDGRWVDPFRPQIEPDGFTSIAALEAERAKHLRAVRQMFETADVLAFTLGLTEAWRARADGAVFPLAPGVSGGDMDFDKYEFVNFTADEVAADLDRFLTRLGIINPRMRVILTVSPVPLVATYEARHVLVSTTYSKSALRVAAEAICKSRSHCAYFPAYEVVTGAFSRGRYFADDLRSVTAEGVDHVMRLFFAHYIGAPEDMSLFDQERIAEAQAFATLVCDEERLGDR